MSAGTPARVRPFNAVLIIAGAWGIVVGLGAGGLVLVVGLDDWAVLPWIVAGIAAGLAFIWSVYRVALEVDKDEIRVFNVRKTYRIPWDAVARVDVVGWWLSPGALPIGNAAVRVTTTSGERIVIDASTREEPKVLQLLASFNTRPEIFGY